MQRVFFLGLGALAILGSVPAKADAGDILIKARGSYHQRLDGFSINLPGENVPVDADIENTTGAEAAITMFLTDHLAAEVSMGGAGYQIKDSTGRRLVSADLLVSTVSLQYHFTPAGQKIRPYIGLGINHLNLYSEAVDLELKNSAPDPFVSYNSKLIGGFAPVAQAGSDIALGEQLFLNFDVKYTSRKTEVRIEREIRATEVRRLSSVIVGLGLGFRF